MADSWFVQCRFRSNNNREETAWIPESGAKKGKRLYFDGDETEIWTVEEVFARQQESYLNEYKMAYKHQREVSDI
jgi:hypothetical protein